MDQETEIIQDTQALHSDMQTLVYENYNKFISATDTIRKVRAMLFSILPQVCVWCNKWEILYNPSVSFTIQPNFYIRILFAVTFLMFSK